MKRKITQKARTKAVPATTAPAVVWHEHSFSPLCDDEVHGRFDAIEDAKGRFYVLDVGAKGRVDNCRTREDACIVAKRFAIAYRRTGRVSRVSKEAVEIWQAAWKTRSATVLIAAKAMKKKYRLACDPSDIAVQPGWLPIIDELLGKLVETGWDRKLAVASQKFCGLRLYLGGESSKKIEAIIRRAKAKCARACEYCGKPHGLTVPRSGTALCEPCEVAQIQLQYGWAKDGARTKRARKEKK